MSIELHPWLLTSTVSPLLGRPPSVTPSTRMHFLIIPFLVTFCQLNFGLELESSPDSSSDDLAASNLMLFSLFSAPFAGSGDFCFLRLAPPRFLLAPAFFALTGLGPLGAGADDASAAGSRFSYSSSS